MVAFSVLAPAHSLDLFDKLISSVLNCGSEFWDFNKAKDVETAHLSFCKRTLGIKPTRDGDLGRKDR